MLVQSTGLGKTVLTSNFSSMEIDKENESFPLNMKIEATDPVHWFITIQLSGLDIRQALKMAMKPAIIAKVIKMLFQKAPKSTSEALHG
ncbi:MAG: hypothetical protein APF81_26345 [Desulfosporosinus sp. BRH_c37]|nr:MAG: hypothetical protein APF81_26345 [Desulfosporosinus sp. BRH_c37]